MTASLRAALFDLDGLLVDSEPLWHEAEITVLGDLGVPLTVEMCRQTKGRYVSEAVRHWQDRYPWDSPGIDAVVARILEVLDDLIATRLELKPGVAHAVSECRDRGLRLAVASSSPLRIIWSVLARFGLEGSFESVCSAEHESAGKPDPAVFLTAARSLGVEPESCVVFEDSLAGVQAAKTAGMLCVAVPEQRITSDRSVFAAADVVLGSLEDLDSAVWSRLELGAGRTVRVTESHRPSARPPIVVRPGDDLVVGVRDDQWPAFVLVTTRTGAEGWVPSRFIERTANGRSSPNRSYDTSELEVDPGAVLTVEEPDLGSGWLWCRDATGSQGWVPARCVEPDEI